MATFEPKITRIESAPSVQTKVKLGRELAKQGKLDEALAEFEAAVKLDPNSKVAHLALGRVKARQENLDDALREFKEVLRIDPMNIQAHLRAARILISKKESDKAEKYVESALRIDPKSPVAHLLLGHIYLSRKDLVKAKEHLLKTLALNPRLVRARIQLAAVLRNEGRISEAMAQLNAAIRIEPDTSNAYEALGRLQLLQKDFGGAREAFEKALTLHPEDTGARLGLAEALIESGELERAEETLRMISSRLQARPGIHKIWGDLYERRGLYAEAGEEYRAALTLASEDTESPAARTPLPPADDLEGWKELAASLKKKTDAFRDEQRWQTPGSVADVEERRGRRGATVRNRRAFMRIPPAGQASAPLRSPGRASISAAAKKGRTCSDEFPRRCPRGKPSNEIGQPRHLLLRRKCEPASQQRLSRSEARGALNCEEMFRGSWRVPSSGRVALCCLCERSSS